MLDRGSNNCYNLRVKTKIFIDFDGTIFNTLAFRDKMFEVFTMAGFSEEEIKNTYAAESLDYTYSPEGQFERLKKIHEFDVSRARLRMDKHINSSPAYLFDDFVPFIKNLNREEYEVDLITLGDIDFQKAKVINSGIVSSFDNVYYCDIQKDIFLSDIVDLNEKFIIVDNRADALEKIAKKYKRSFPIFIDRVQKDLDDPALLNQVKFTGISVKSMKQAAQYL